MHVLLASSPFSLTLNSYPPKLHLIPCLMSMSTTSGLPSTSLELSLTQGSSPSLKHGNFVLRSTSDPTSPMRMPLPLLLPNKSQTKSNYNSQVLEWLQCPRMHYHPWCSNCQTLMGWEPPQPITPKPKKSIPTFGQLKKVVRMHCQSPFRWQIKQQSEMKKVCSKWREEQFTQAIVKRNAHIAAWEALHHQAHWQHMDCGATPPA